MKNVWIAGGVIAGAVALMFFFRTEPEVERYPMPSNPPGPGEVVEEDRTKGNPDAGVVLVEYSDFECPACGSYYPVLKQLMEDYEEDLLFVYRHFPLVEIHSNAHLAGRVSEAAGNQGMFWEMHDRIFEGQSSWRGRTAQPIFIGYAEELGLDMDRFRADLDSDEVIEQVQRGLASGMRANVRGTPTFFVNGERIENPGSYEEFTSVIDRYLAEQE